MNILVTGGAGYIGSVITDYLIRKKHKVVILDDLSTGYKELINPCATFVKGSILKTNTLSQLFENNKIDLVFHAAAKTAVSESVLKPAMYLKNNTEGTKKLLTSMNTYGIEKLIFCSSAAVYGEPKKTPILESDTKHPCNPYGKSKLLAEKLIINSKIKYCIFRFFNVAGANGKYGMMKKKPTLLIPVVNKAIANNTKPIIFGNKYKTPDGTCIRDYIHVNDLSKATLRAIQQLNNNQSNIYNLGSGSGYSVLSIVKLAIKLNCKKMDYVMKSRRKGDPARLIASITKAQKKLRWQPTYSIRQMIQDDIKFRKIWKI